MCGIAGIAGLTGGPVLESVIRKMTDRLAHRGPDAEGFFISDEAALGHRRLSIIDLSEVANQPLFDPTGRYSIILNGEIYNYKELRSTFPNYPYRTNGDSETILAAYMERGADCLSLLNGMFAFAIWDDERKEMFVARDRLGVKPLYYHQSVDGTFLFASEIRALLESGFVDKRLDRSAVFEYLMYQSVYSPRTIVENVRQLPAGCYGVFKNSAFSIVPYWKIENTSSDIAPPTSRAEAVREVRELFARSIERRMVSDVPVGAFLSGGIDSSAVVAMMSQVSDQPVNSFSVVFDDKGFDESQYSDRIAKKFNTRHTEIRLTADDLLAELPNALRAVDSPSGDGLNTYVVSKVTKQAGVTVALSGLGGDELFAGYHYYRQWQDLRNGLLPKVPGVGRKLASTVLSATGRPKLQRVADILADDEIDLSTVYPRTRQVMPRATALRYQANGNGPDPLQAMLAERAIEIEAFPVLSQYSIGDLLGYTQNVLLKDVDQFSMASALEVREPFFDHHLIEYVLRVPDEFKLGDRPKSLLVDSLGGLLPDEIIDRKKMGFTLPLEKWMRGELREFCDARISGLAKRGLIDSDLLKKKWNQFGRGEGGVRWSELWHLVVLTEWLENNKF
jgi:asparagine synthase (glutamine-hydrolysing)